MLDEVEYGEFRLGLRVKWGKGEGDIVAEAGWTEEAANLLLL